MGIWATHVCTMMTYTVWRGMQALGILVSQINSVSGLLFSQCFYLPTHTHTHTNVHNYTIGKGSHRKKRVIKEFNGDLNLTTYHIQGRNWQKKNSKPFKKLRFRELNGKTRQHSFINSKIFIERLLCFCLDRIYQNTAIGDK